MGPTPMGGSWPARAYTSGGAHGPPTAAVSLPPSDGDG